MISQQLSNMFCKTCTRCFNRQQLHVSSSVRRLGTFQNLRQNAKFIQQPIKSTYKLPQLVQQFRFAATDASAQPIPARAEKIIGRWLMGCAGMCFGAVILGGVTRLTESGLSMVDWKLLKDMTPPRSQQAWEQEFERYKQFPEYKYVSSQKEVTLSDFKFIFYMEYLHRMWGRATGLVFLLPAAYFLKKGWVTRAMKPRLAIYASLIGLQGFLGWYMVKSGLKESPSPSDVPRVSQYRLATHLGTAFFLYALLFYQGLQHLLPPQLIPDTKRITTVRRLTHPLMTVVVVTAISGAFVAGLDAGLIYNTYPKMANKWIPDDLCTISPKWKNIFENPTTVQFNHRLLGETTFVSVAGFWWLCRKAPLPSRARMAVNCLFAMVTIQAGLGITTLLTHVPTSIAASHQSGSLVLLSIAVWLAHELKRLPK